MTEDLCTQPQCGHPFDPHVVIATGSDPVEGGIMLCPEPGCQCYATWSPDGHPVMCIPRPEVVAIFRAEVQTR